jgi:hypothetical protein
MLHPIQLRGPWAEWHYSQHLIRDALTRRARSTGDRRRQSRWVLTDVRHALRALDEVLTALLLAVPWLADDSFDEADRP